MDHFVTNPQLIQQSSFSNQVLSTGCSKQSIKQEFLRTHQAYEQLFSILASDDVFYEKPQPRRHPLIFYYGHTACFYLNKLYSNGIVPDRLNAEYEQMFATGVDEMDWDDMDETHYQWPAVDEVRKYRNEAKDIVLMAIDNMDINLHWESDLWTIFMAISHDRIHFETSAVIIRRLPMEKTRESKVLKDCPFYTVQKNNFPMNELITVSNYKKTWDRQRETTSTFGWDNEFGHKEINISEFQASKMLVSNGEYLQFVENQGYFKHQYWCKEGLKWLAQDKPSKPIFWVESQNGYMLRTLNKLMDLPLNWPVEVNNLEASAFCKWKSEKTGLKIKLPTEDEYLALRASIKTDFAAKDFKKVGNMNLNQWVSPCPINMYETNGFYDVVGNLFQHTCTPLYPFSKFECHPSFEDYSTPFFDGKNFLMRGGSFLSDHNIAFNARHGFRRHFYQFAGIRYVVSDNEDNIAQAKEQSDKLVDLSIQIHYCQEETYIMKATERIKEKLSKLGGKSLVVGCSVGKLMLEMSKIFHFSEGLDFTSRFFQIASRMMQKGSMIYKGKKISIQEDNYDISKNKLIRMNPVNIHTGKLSKYRFIIFDGFALREDNMKRAIPNFLPFLEGEAYVSVINASNRNWVQEKEVKQMSCKLTKVDEIQLGMKTQVLSMSMYKYKC